MLTIQKHFPLWENLYSKIQKQLKQSKYVDNDIPVICFKAGEIACQDGNFEEGFLLFDITSNQYSQCGNVTELEKLKKVMQTYKT